ALYHRIVTLEHRIYHPFADARPGKDRLGKDSARQHHAHLQANGGDDRDHGVSQRVNADDAKWRQALRARRADIILRQHFEHGRARLAGNDGERNGAQHDGRQDEVAYRRGKCALLPRQQRIDQHEAGDRREKIEQVDAAGYGRPAQYSRKENDEQKAPPEDRHGVANQGCAHHRLVEEGAALDGCKYTGRNTKHDGKDDGADRKLKRSGKQGEELLDDRLLGDDGRAEITGEYASDIGQILHDQRPIHAELVHDLRVAGRIHHPLAGHQHDRIARQQPDEGKGYYGHTYEGGDQDQQPAYQEFEHGNPIAPRPGRVQRDRAESCHARPLGRARPPYSAMSTLSKRWMPSGSWV